MTRLELLTLMLETIDLVEVETPDQLLAIRLKAKIQRLFDAQMEKSWPR